MSLYAVKHTSCLGLFFLTEMGWIFLKQGVPWCLMLPVQRGFTIGSYIVKATSVKARAVPGFSLPEQSQGRMSLQEPDPIRGGGGWGAPTAEGALFLMAACTLQTMYYSAFLAPCKHVWVAACALGQAS